MSLSIPTTLERRQRCARDLPVIFDQGALVHSMWRKSAELRIADNIADLPSRLAFYRSVRAALVI